MTAKPAVHPASEARCRRQASASGLRRYGPPRAGPGRERDRYRVHDDVWFEAMVRRDREIARWRASLHEGVDVLGAGTPAGERMARTAEFFAFLEGELAGMLDRWRAQRASD